MTLSPSNQRYLESLRNHPAAPLFNWTWSVEITPDIVEMVEVFGQRARQFPPRWSWGEQPAWVAPFTEACLTQVPFFRDYAETAWSSGLRTMSRSDLRVDPERFFPDGSDCEGMVYHETSGTTGTKIKLHSHPVTGECYMALLEKALEWSGVKIERGPNQVAVILVFHHTTTLTYPQICPVLGDAAFIRLNLHPTHWKNLDDRLVFLDHCSPQVFTGTPLSLVELAKFPMKQKPKALVTTSMALLPATRAFLEEHFQCPLIDLYSLAECRCVAARSDDGHLRLLAHDVFVEILDEDGKLCQPGQVGEIVLTGGRNPYLPLLRYRTGDFAAMHWSDDGEPLLSSLEGRAPVSFQLADGSLRNNMEVTRALADLPLTQFALHQEADRSLAFRYRGAPELASSIKGRLDKVFEQLPLEVEWVEESLGPKWIAYSTSLKL